MRSRKSFSALDERAMLHGILTGCERAWRVFHRRFDRLIGKAIATALGPAACDDDIQEVYATFFMQLLAEDMRKLRSFDRSRGARLSSWVSLLAMHCAYDWMRSTHFDEYRAPLSEAEVMPCLHPSPFESVEQKERAALLAGVLGALPDKDREFVDLYFGEELSTEEIAARLQISITTVYTKRHRIQCRLSEMLSSSTLVA